MKNSRAKLKKAAGGFALIEVVIAMFILAIGILGAGALQTVGMQTTQGAYYRSQAMFLAGDALNRMRANRKVASSYLGDTNTQAELGCLDTATGCTPAQLAVDDMRQWAKLVSESGLPDALGTITSPTPNQYRIRITWSENEWQANKYQRAADTKSYELNVALDNH